MRPFLLALLGSSGALALRPFDACEPLNLTFVYAAQAEAYDVIHEALLFASSDPLLFGLRGAGYVDRLVAVGGSFAHISLLLGLDAREIFYVDVNKDQLLMNEALVALVRLSEGRARFLSAFFGREQAAFDVGRMDTQAPVPGEHMQEVAAVPVSEAVVAEVYEKVGREAGEGAACAYAALVKEYTARPVPQKVGRICDFLSIYGYPNIHFPEEVQASICSLQFGKGWLASDAAYAIVRDRLTRSRVKFLQRDLFSDFPEVVSADQRSVVYTSNIFTMGERGNIDRIKQHLEAAYIAGAGYAHVSHFEQFFPKAKTDWKVTQLQWSSDRRYKKHMAALSAVGLQLAAFNDLVEVTVTTPYGFREFDEGAAVAELNGELFQLEVARKNRVNVDPAGFRALAVNDNVVNVSALAGSACLLHILLGGGGGDEEFFATLALALLACGRVIVLEHNRESLDFRAAPPAWAAKKWLSASRLHQLLLAMASRASGLPEPGALPSFAECVQGLLDGCRNVVVVFDGYLARGFAPREAPALEGFLPGFLSYAEAWTKRLG